MTALVTPCVWWQIATLDGNGNLVEISEAKTAIRRVRKIAHHTIKLPPTSCVVVTEFRMDERGISRTTGKVARYRLDSVEVEA